VHDALDLVTGERLEKIAGRRAIVVLTDGMDVGSRYAGAGGVMARLESANIPVYAVQFESGEVRKTGSRRLPPPPRQPAITSDRYFDRIVSFDHAKQYLSQLTRNTGGLLLPAATADAIVQAFRRAAEDVRSQYVLYYYPSNQVQDGALRRIRVEVTRPGVTVRARAGYRAPGPR
jgi:Ca-activated chloride channel family protein